MRLACKLALGWFALAGCTDGESPQDQLEQLRAEAGTSCWTHFCQDGPGAIYPHPSVPTDQGVDCMNDALANGVLAMSEWGVENFSAYTETHTYLFVVDGQVRVFRSNQHGENPADVYELQNCSGPFHIGARICLATDPDAPGGFIDVNAVSPSGCL